MYRLSNVYQLLSIDYQLAIVGYRILGLKERTYIANQLLTIDLDCIQLSNINPRLSSLDYRFSTNGFESLSICPFHLQSGELALLRAHMANIFAFGIDSVILFYFFFLVFSLSNIWYFLNVFHIFVWFTLFMHLLSFADMYIYIHLYTFTHIWMYYNVSVCIYLVFNIFINFTINLCLKNVTSYIYKYFIYTYIYSMYIYPCIYIFKIWCFNLRMQLPQHLRCLRFCFLFFYYLKFYVFLFICFVFIVFCFISVPSCHVDVAKLEAWVEKKSLVSF